MYKKWKKAYSKLGSSWEALRASPSILQQNKTLLQDLHRLRIYLYHRLQNRLGSS